jgi:hypothetical protein
MSTDASYARHSILAITVLPAAEATSVRIDNSAARNLALDMRPAAKRKKIGAGQPAGICTRRPERGIQ